MFDIEGLWLASFFAKPETGLGNGVIVLETERLFGGDNQYYYLGTYQVKNDHIEGKIDVTHYSGPGFSIFGRLEQFTLTFIGSIDKEKEEISILGRLQSDPSVGMILQCRKVANLPG